MKRDLKLIKEILEEAEESGEPWITFSQSNCDPAKIYNVELLLNAKLLNSDGDTPIIRRGDTGGIMDITISGLTWEGHDFSDASRDDTAWNKVNEHISKGGSWTFAVVPKVLAKVASEQVQDFLDQ